MKEGYNKKDDILLQLIESGDIQEIEALNLTKEAINTPDKDGRTPIFWCCTFGKSKILEYFLDLGADINITDKVCLIYRIIMHKYSVFIFFIQKHRENGLLFMWLPVKEMLN